LISLTNEAGSRTLAHYLLLPSTPPTFEPFQSFQKPALSPIEGACPELAEGFNRFKTFAGLSSSYHIGLS